MPKHATAVLAATAALLLAPNASASGGRYVFEGGTAAEQAQARRALDVSLFDWSVVDRTITIRIAPGLDSQAVPGEIDLDADLLDAGVFSWGVVQHEYAHEVDFFVLDERLRTTLSASLGGSSWWQTAAGLPHGELTSERFASTLAWAYWPSPENSMRPLSRFDESGAVAPAAFRRLLGGLLGSVGPDSRR